MHHPDNFAQNLKNANSPAFKTKKQNKKDALNKDYLTWFVGGSSILATLLLGLISAKNIRKSDELIKKSAENTRKGLDNIIKSFNEKEKIIPVKDHDGNILKGIDAYKYVIETMEYSSKEALKGDIDMAGIISPTSGKIEKYIKMIDILSFL